MNNNINVCAGLSRSGSTVLMNILQQHPDIFTSSTCPLPEIITELSRSLLHCPSFVAMEHDLSQKSIAEFTRTGIEGWYNNLTQKPIRISKSRVWGQCYYQLIYTYERPKIILTIRDLRGIIFSYHSVIKDKRPYSVTSVDFQKLYMKDVVDIQLNEFLADSEQRFNDSYALFKQLLERLNTSNFNKDDICIVRYEDLVSNPRDVVNHVTSFLGADAFNYDLNNIQQNETYQHDTHYDGFAYHKTQSTVGGDPDRWRRFMPREVSDYILERFNWYYRDFYPERL